MQRRTTKDRPALSPLFHSDVPPLRVWSRRLGLPYATLPWVILMFTVIFVVSSIPFDYNCLPNNNDPLGLENSKWSHSIHHQTRNTDSTKSSISVDHHDQTKPMNVLLGASNSDPAFLQELHMVIKTILLHRPIDYPLDIHIMTDMYGKKFLRRFFGTIELGDWKIGAHAVRIHIYPIPKETTQKWDHQIKNLFARHGFSTQEIQTHLLHKVGTYFRLYAHQILLPSVSDVLYIDTDIVLLANLQALWPTPAAVGTKEDSPLFSWTSVQCAGFMLQNIRPGLEEVWNLVEQAPPGQMRDFVPDHNPNDQLILRYIQKVSPQRVGTLSDVWDGTVAAGLWKNGKDLAQVRPQLGMMHFNGGGLRGSYWKVHGFLQGSKVGNSSQARTWGLAHAQIDMPWVWVRTQVESSSIAADGSSNSGVIILIHSVLEQGNRTVVKYADTP